MASRPSIPNQRMSKKTSRGSDLSPREAIANAAVRLFGARGYSGTTMRDLAQEVGLLAGSLYAHIDSKETLLAEIVQGGFEQFLAIARRLDASSDAPQVKLREAIVAHTVAVAENPERTLVVLHQWRFLAEPDRQKAVAMRRSYAQTFINIIDEGIASGVFSPKLNARIAVFGILGALNWTSEWYSPDGSASAQEIGVWLADALIGGLGTGPLGAPGAQRGTEPAKRAAARSVAMQPTATRRHTATKKKLA